MEWNRAMAILWYTRCSIHVNVLSIIIIIYIDAINCNISSIVYLANGRVSVEGSTATYTCDTGYTLSGSSSRTCRDNGSWSSPEPLCNGRSYCHAPSYQLQ